MRISTRPNDPLAPSVDRIDSAEGYVEGNVCLCCNWVNKAKGSLSAKEFLDILKQATQSMLSPENVL